jgi:hypothetical protein
MSSAKRAALVSLTNWMRQRSTLAISASMSEVRIHHFEPFLSKPIVSTTNFSVSHDAQYQPPARISAAAWLLYLLNNFTADSNAESFMK